MKSLLLVCLSLMSIGVVAAEQCPTHFSCGVFKLSSPSDSGKPVEKTVTITGEGANLAQFDYVIHADGEEDQDWNLITKFEDNGSFTMNLLDGTPYASGICSGQFCSYAMHPWPKGDLVSANVGFLVFEGDKLTLDMFYGHPGSAGESRQVFTRKP